MDCKNNVIYENNEANEHSNNKIIKKLPNMQKSMRYMLS